MEKPYKHFYAIGWLYSVFVLHAEAKFIALIYAEVSVAIPLDHAFLGFSVSYKLSLAHPCRLNPFFSLLLNLLRGQWLVQATS